MADLRPPRLRTECAFDSFGAAAVRRRHGLAAVWLAVWLAFAALCWPAPASAQAPAFDNLQVVRNEDGLFASFDVRFELPRAVEDALGKGVPLYFVVEATLYSDRWYWTDRREARASRVWRLAYQPLTRKYRVTIGGSNQSFDTLAEALAVVRRVNHWKIAEAAQVEPGGGHYVEFSYRLDTTLLPRPMQIGIGGQPEWTLVIEKTQRLN